MAFPRFFSAQQDWAPEFFLISPWLSSGGFHFGSFGKFRPATRSSGELSTSELPFCGEGDGAPGRRAVWDGQARFYVTFCTILTNTALWSKKWDRTSPLLNILQSLNSSHFFLEKEVPWNFFMACPVQSLGETQFAKSSPRAEQGTSKSVCPSFSRVFASSDSRNDHQRSLSLNPVELLACICLPHRAQMTTPLDNTRVFFSHSNNV